MLTRTFSSFFSIEKIELTRKEVSSTLSRAKKRRNIWLFVSLPLYVNNHPPSKSYVLLTRGYACLFSIASTVDRKSSLLFFSFSSSFLFLVVVLFSSLYTQWVLRLRLQQEHTRVCSTSKHLATNHFWQFLLFDYVILTVNISKKVCDSLLSVPIWRNLERMCML
jgi:SNF family Na+-dependent transporter